MSLQMFMGGIISLFEAVDGVCMDGPSNTCSYDGWWYHPCWLHSGSNIAYLPSLREIASMGNRSSQ